MHKLLAVSTLHFKEAVQERPFAAVCGLALFLLSLWLFLGHLTLGEQRRILTDAGLSGIELCGLVIAIFLAVNVSVREAETKQLDLFLVYTSRSNVILGKFLGFAALIGLFLAGAYVGLAGLLALYQGLSLALLVAWYYTYLKLLIALGVTLVCCTVFRSAFLILFSSLSIYVASEWFSSGLVFSRLRAGGDGRVVLLEWLYRLLPNLDKLDVKPLVTYGLRPDGATMALHTLYALAYLGALLALAVLLFRGREV